MKNCLRLHFFFTALLFSLLAPNAVRAEEGAYAFQGQNKSLIKWKELETKKWMDFHSWRKERTLKNSYPDWEVKVRERSNRSLMGRVLDCVGECRVYKGEDFIRAGFRNTLHQGDEIITSEDSYMWLYLLDGTLVRLSPDSSLTLRELNIGEKENFLHARLNSGNILWLSRSKRKHIEENLRETDALFLPLVYHQANPVEPPEQELDEDNLFEAFEEDQTVLKQIKRLNKMIEQNNEWVQERETYSFLVAPNGSFFGKQIQAEFIVLLGGESYVKRRDYQQLRLQSEEKETPPKLTYFYRGFENTSEFSVENDQWYRVNDRGRLISTYKPSSLFRMGEFVTRRIPSILVARELLLKRYSQFVYQDLSAMELAEEHGYRKWGQLNKEGDDLAQRLSFVKEQTRRVETSLLLTASRFKDQVLREDGEVLKSMEYSSRFFNRALTHFQRKREVESLYGAQEERLNSTKKPFWKIIHARRFERAP